MRLNSISRCSSGLHLREAGLGAGAFEEEALHPLPDSDRPGPSINPFLGRGSTLVSMSVATICTGGVIVLKASQAGDRQAVRLLAGGRRAAPDRTGPRPACF